ncbi:MULTISPECIES: hypothetical protein [Pseudomonas]|nr:MULTISPECIES: hypothetical protein [Pseudomonas]MDT8921302.1 hypothetical protein [Pseudomonas taiwanensis]WEZ86757.1 hypothetical protein P3R38_14700 [Pseudomonas sp. NyZ480]
MNIYVETSPEQNRWWVRMDDCRVSFTTPDEAQAFVDRLNARLNAPHSRDMLADWSPRPGMGSTGKANARMATQADLRCAKEA